MAEVSAQARMCLSCDGTYLISVEIKLPRVISGVSIGVMPPRPERLIELRDQALTVVKARGRVMPFAGGPPRLVYREGKGRRCITIAYRMLAKRGCYDLDVTTRTGLMKIEWSNEGRVDVVSYKPGAWENRLGDLSYNVTCGRIPTELD
jgi:hypothetical protein